MKNDLEHLPIDDVLDELKAQLVAFNSAVLVAAPGAGKTTRIPLAIMNEPWSEGKTIIVLEPRRIAARNAAGFMAKLLNEKVGQTVGYRVRMDNKVSASTRIIVVTEGVFTRMVLDDPELSKVAAVLFDEYHERSLEADLGLALSLDVQNALRPDLRLLVMSATLDGAKVNDLFENSKIIESKGRSFPLEINHFLPQANERPVDAMVRAILQISKTETGSILCFLPGQGEINKCAEKLKGKLPSHINLQKLYGSLSPREQDAAISPVESGKQKVVLATSIAETSITIAGVNCVIDSGLARVPIFEPDMGLTRLETVRASKASVTQRAGRAGRTSAGKVYRLWNKGQTAALPDFETPEILQADLSTLVLDLALWGVSDPKDLNWLDTPPPIAWKEAKNLLIQLGALDEKGAITDKGKLMRTMPLAPRLANMVLAANKFGQAKTASWLAFLVSERGLGGNSPDISERLDRFVSDGSTQAKKFKQTAETLIGKIGNPKPKTDLSAGGIISLAYPDRIAKRIGNNDRGDVLFQMANGRRASLDGLSKLSSHAFLAISQTQGKAALSRIISAAPIELNDILDLHKAMLEKKRQLKFNSDTKQFKASETIQLDKLTLVSQPTKLLVSDDLAQGLLVTLKSQGIESALRNLELLPSANNIAAKFLNRMRFLSFQKVDGIKNIENDALVETLEDWLLPFIENARSLADISSQKIYDALCHLVGYENLKLIETLAPSFFEVPTGSKIQLHYEEEKAVLAVRVQELYGMKSHPVILSGAFPITIELLSPAQRPIQTTKDIVGFWSGSWQDVKKEMKGRYPRHLWPDDPANTAPTTRIKKKM